MDFFAYSHTVEFPTKESATKLGVQLAGLVRKLSTFIINVDAPRARNATFL